MRQGILQYRDANNVIHQVNLATSTVCGDGTQACDPLGIGISLVIVIIAALNLILDFDMIETAARMGAPKYMEWYGAFGLMVTLIWLYMEILRLLAKTRRR